MQVYSAIFHSRALKCQNYGHEPFTNNIIKSQTKILSEYLLSQSKNQSLSRQAIILRNYLNFLKFQVKTVPPARLELATPHQSLNGRQLPNQQSDSNIIIISMRPISNSAQKNVASCTICMERPSNCALNGCPHQFCLRCIRKWSKTKNTCPLCRERFTRLECKRKTIEVENIPERVRTQRIPLPLLPLGHQIHQSPQPMVYLPLLIYPQNPCLIYACQPGLFLHAGIGNQQPLSFSFPTSAFFSHTL